MNYSAKNNLQKYNFARHTNWINPNYQYIKNVKIVEWDIKSAGLSVIKFHKLLTPEEISKLESMSKKMRTVREGLYQKENPVLAEKIVKTLEDVRQGFALLNDISADDVLSIKKDAIFLINKNVSHDSIKDVFKFRKKEEYTSYLQLNKHEFYINSKGELDTKGLSKDVIEKQEKFFLKDICYFMKMSEKVNSQQLFNILKNYRSKYINKELPVETYRELNTGLFRLNGDILTDVVDESVLDEMDITQNFMNYLLPLFRLML